MEHPEMDSGTRGRGHQAEHRPGRLRTSDNAADSDRLSTSVGSDGFAANGHRSSGRQTDEDAVLEGRLTPPIRVFLVEDHMVVRAGIRFMLRALRDIELVGEAASGEEALAACPPLQPDVILMDLKLPGQDGITTIRALREASPNQHIVVLTSFDNPEFVRDALQAGATSYLLKQISADNLAEAIRQAHCGLATVSPDLIQTLIASAASIHQESAHSSRDLSDRELEVLTLLVRGLSNKQIADRLVVAPVTVKYHTQRLRMILGARSRTELVALALQRNIIQPSLE